MEFLLETKSLPSLLIGIIVIMLAHLLKGIIEFLWTIKRREDDAKERTLKEISLDIKKLNQSVNNSFLAIKFLAGPKWDQISKKIQEKNIDY